MTMEINNCALEIQSQAAESSGAGAALAQAGELMAAHQADFVLVPGGGIHHVHFSEDENEVAANFKRNVLARLQVQTHHPFGEAKPKVTVREHGPHGECIFEQEARALRGGKQFQPSLLRVRKHSSPHLCSHPHLPDLGAASHQLSHKSSHTSLYDVHANGSVVHVLVHEDRHNVTALNHGSLGKEHHVAESTTHGNLKLIRIAPMSIQPRNRSLKEILDIPGRIALEDLRVRRQGTTPEEESTETMGRKYNHDSMADEREFRQALINMAQHSAEGVSAYMEVSELLRSEAKASLGSPLALIAIKTMIEEERTTPALIDVLSTVGSDLTWRALVDRIVINQTQPMEIRARGIQALSFLPSPLAHQVEEMMNLTSTLMDKDLANDALLSLGGLVHNLEQTRDKEPGTNNTVRAAAALFLDLLDKRLNNNDVSGSELVIKAIGNAGTRFTKDALVLLINRGPTLELRALSMDALRRMRAEDVDEDIRLALMEAYHDINHTPIGHRLKAYQMLVKVGLTDDNVHELVHTLPSKAVQDPELAEFVHRELTSSIENQARSPDVVVLPRRHRRGDDPLSTTYNSTNTTTDDGSAYNSTDSTTDDGSASDTLVQKGIDKLGNLLKSSEFSTDIKILENVKLTLAKTKSGIGVSIGFIKSNKKKLLGNDKFGVNIGFKLHDSAKVHIPWKGGGKPRFQATVENEAYIEVYAFGKEHRLAELGFKAEGLDTYKKKTADSGDSGGPAFTTDRRRRRAQARDEETTNSALTNLPKHTQEASRLPRSTREILEESMTLADSHVGVDVFLRKVDGPGVELNDAQSIERHQCLAHVAESWVDYGNRDQPDSALSGNIFRCNGLLISVQMGIETLIDLGQASSEVLDSRERGVLFQVAHLKEHCDLAAKAHISGAVFPLWGCGALVHAKSAETVTFVMTGLHGLERLEATSVNMAMQSKTLAGIPLIAHSRLSSKIISVFESKLLDLWGRIYNLGSLAVDTSPRNTMIYGVKEKNYAVDTFTVVLTDFRFSLEGQFSREEYMIYCSLVWSLSMMYEEHQTSMHLLDFANSDMLQSEHWFNNFVHEELKTIDLSQFYRKLRQSPPFWTMVCLFYDRAMESGMQVPREGLETFDLFKTFVMSIFPLESPQDVNMREPWTHKRARRYVNRINHDGSYTHIDYNYELIAGLLRIVDIRDVFIGATCTSDFSHFTLKFRGAKYLNTSFWRAVTHVDASPPYTCTDENDSESSFTVRIEGNVAVSEIDGTVTFQATRVPMKDLYHTSKIHYIKETRKQARLPSVKVCGKSGSRCAEREVEMKSHSKDPYHGDRARRAAEAASLPSLEGRGFDAKNADASLRGKHTGVAGCAWTSECLFVKVPDGITTSVMLSGNPAIEYELRAIRRGDKNPAACTTKDLADVENSISRSPSLTFTNTVDDADASRLEVAGTPVWFEVSFRLSQMQCNTGIGHHKVELSIDSVHKLDYTTHYDKWQSHHLQRRQRRDTSQNQDVQNCMQKDDLKCCDDPSFEDANGYKCEDWDGDDCNQLEWLTATYTQDEVDHVKEHCPVACGIGPCKRSEVSWLKVFTSLYGKTVAEFDPDDRFVIHNFKVLSIKFKCQRDDMGGKSACGPDFVSAVIVKNSPDKNSLDTGEFLDPGAGSHAELYFEYMIEKAALKISGVSVEFLFSASRNDLLGKWTLPPARIDEFKFKTQYDWEVEIRNKMIFKGAGKKNTYHDFVIANFGVPYLSIPCGPAGSVGLAAKFGVRLGLEIRFEGSFTYRSSTRRGGSRTIGFHYRHNAGLVNLAENIMNTYPNEQPQYEAKFKAEVGVTLTPFLELNLNIGNFAMIGFSFEVPLSFTLGFFIRAINFPQGIASGDDGWAAQSSYFTDKYCNAEGYIDFEFKIAAWRNPGKFPGLLNFLPTWLGDKFKTWGKRLNLGKFITSLEQEKVFIPASDPVTFVNQKVNLWRACLAGCNLDVHCEADQYCKEGVCRDLGGPCSDHLDGTDESSCDSRSIIITSPSGSDIDIVSSGVPAIDMDIRGGSQTLKVRLSGWPRGCSGKYKGESETSHKVYVELKAREIDNYVAPYITIVEPEATPLTYHQQELARRRSDSNGNPGYVATSHYLEFDKENWNIPQSVKILIEEDRLAVDGVGAGAANTDSGYVVDDIIDIEVKSAKLDGHELDAKISGQKDDRFLCMQTINIRATPTDVDQAGDVGTNNSSGCISGNCSNTANLGTGVGSCSFELPHLCVEFCAVDETLCEYVTRDGSSSPPEQPTPGIPCVPEQPPPPQSQDPPDNRKRRNDNIDSAALEPSTCNMDPTLGEWMPAGLVINLQAFCDAQMEMEPDDSADTPAKSNANTDADASTFDTDLETWTNSLNSDPDWNWKTNTPSEEAKQEQFAYESPGNDQRLYKCIKHKFGLKIHDTSPGSLFPSSFRDKLRTLRGEIHPDTLTREELLPYYRALASGGRVEGHDGTEVPSPSLSDRITDAVRQSYDECCCVTEPTTFSRWLAVAFPALARGEVALEMQSHAICENKADPQLPDESGVKVYFYAKVLDVEIKRFYVIGDPEKDKTRRSTDEGTGVFERAYREEAWAAASDPTSVKRHEKTSQASSDGTGLIRARRMAAASSGGGKKAKKNGNSFAKLGAKIKSKLGGVMDEIKKDGKGKALALLLLVIILRRTRTRILFGECFRNFSK